ncbi:MAG: DUF6089 family protein [Cyclobacteriaceae bacterium]
MPFSLKHLYYQILLCAILLVLIKLPANAQRHEAGLGVGAMMYTGDLARYPKLAQTKPGITAFYRQNYGPFLSARFSLLAGGLSGSDEQPYDALAEVRQNEFNVFVTEFAMIGEFNFLDIHNKHSLIHWTPYMFAGLGAFAFFGHEENPTASYSNVQPVVPFGLGLKFALSPQFTLDITYGFRMLFTDYLDNVSGGEITERNFQHGNRFDKDMYQFFGISLGYTFYSIPCPFDFY